MRPLLPLPPPPPLPEPGLLLLLLVLLVKLLLLLTLSLFDELEGSVGTSLDGPHENFRGNLFGGFPMEQNLIND